MRYFLVLILLIGLGGPLWATSYEEGLSHFYAGRLVKAQKILSELSVDRYPELPYLQALLALKQGQLGRSLLYISNYTPPIGSASNYVDFLKIQQALSVGDVVDARLILRRLQKTVSTPYFSDLAQLKVADWYLQNEQYKACKALLQGLLGKRRETVLYPRFIASRIRLAMREDDIEEALRRYGELVILNPRVEEDNRLWRDMTAAFSQAISISDAFATSDMYALYIKSLFKFGMWKSLIQQSEQFIAENPSYPFLNDIQILRARAYSKLYQYGKAIPIYQSITRQRSSQRHVGASLFYTGYALVKMRRYDQAQLAFENYLDGFETPYFGADSHYYLSRYYKQNGPYRKFRFHHDNFSDRYGQSIVFKRFVWESDWKAMTQASRSVSDQEAQKKLSDIFQDPRLYEQVLGFYEAVSQPKSVYRPANGPASFRDRLRQFSLSYSVKEMLRHYVNRFGKYSLRYLRDRSKVTRHYDQLYRLGLGREGADELQYYRDLHNKFPIQYLFAQTSLQYKLGEYGKGIKLMEKGITYQKKQAGEVPYVFMRLLYPRAYWKTVKRFAQKYEVDPYLVLAVMREESHFDATARSWTQAIGLMQIVPKTGKDIAWRLGKAWKGPDLLLDPEVNIEFGIYYLSWLQKMFDGRVHYMLSGYNSGPTITRRWVGEFGTEDALVFARKLPYPETEDYIKRVMDTYILYKLLYPKT